MEQKSNKLFIENIQNKPTFEQESDDFAGEDIKVFYFVIQA